MHPRGFLFEMEIGECDSPGRGTRRGGERALDYGKHSDDQLMANIAEGDSAAFKALAERYLRRLAMYCHACLGNAADADDILQDVLIQILRVAPEYRAEGRFQAWLFTLARNRCLNLLRAKGASPTVGAAPAEVLGRISADGPAALDVLIQSETVGLMEVAVDSFSPEDRELLRLRIEEGLSLAEISRRTGQPRSSIHDRISMITNILRVKLKIT